jgi:hypothetical protein
MFALWSEVGFKLIGIHGRGLIHSGKMSSSQNRRRSSVELCNPVQDLDGLVLPASADEELGRLLEGKDKVTQEEDDQSGASENDECISPTHVAVGSAARSFTSVAGGIIGITAPLGSCSSAIGDGRGYNNTNGLPQREESDEEAAVLGKKFEGNGCINRDVATKT